MRNRLRVALGALTALLLAAPAAVHTAYAAPPGPAAPERPALPSRPAVPLPWGDDLTIDRTGDVTRDGTVTLYGTYRCVYDGMDHPRANILVTLAQGEERHGIGATAAVCDGQLHRWMIEGTGEGWFERGPARAEGRMVKFGSRHDFVPMLRTTAGAERVVHLTASED